MDLVTLRAVEEFEKVLPITLDVVKLGGRAGLMVGKDQIEKAKLLSPNFEWKQPVKVPAGEARVLLAGTKVVNGEPK